MNVIRQHSVLPDHVQYFIFSMLELARGPPLLWEIRLLMHLQFLSAFAELRKGTIGFVMSVCPSVRPSAWNNSAPTGRIFMKFGISVSFEKKTVEKMLVSLKSDKNNVYFTWRQIYTFWSHLAQLFLQWEIFFPHKSCKENENTFYVLQLFFFLKSCRTWENVKKKMQSRTGYRWHGAYALHAAYLRLQTHTQNK